MTAGTCPAMTTFGRYVDTSSETSGGYDGRWVSPCAALATFCGRPIVRVEPLSTEEAMRRPAVWRDDIVSPTLVAALGAASGIASLAATGDLFAAVAFMGGASLSGAP